MLNSKSLPDRYPWIADIESGKTWESVEPVNKGWSSDKKYHIRTSAGEHLLLRISGIAQYNEKKKEYEIIEKYSALGFPMSSPVAFGVCNNGQNVYILLRWIEGCDLETVLPELSKEEQYRLGREAGSILQKIHGIPLEKGNIPGSTKKEKKLWQLSSTWGTAIRSRAENR